MEPNTEHTVRLATDINVGINGIQADTRRIKHEPGLSRAGVAGV